MRNYFRPADCTARDDTKVDLAEIGGAHELAHEIQYSPRQPIEETTLAKLNRWEREDAAAELKAAKPIKARKSRIRQRKAA